MSDDPVAEGDENFLEGPVPLGMASALR